MGALRQPLRAENLKKPPAVESRKLDQYGRDPASPVEQLRGGTGFSPLFHAMLADLPRLVEGSAAGWALVMTILRLSLGRPHDADKGRYEKTEPISTAELAELCRVNVKTIQRQLDELSERGVISRESKGAKTGKYVLSLRLSEWRKLPDYPVWQKLQIKAVDDSPADDETEDSDLTEISKDAVHLFKKPAVLRPGRASRAVKVNTGIKEFVCENESPTVDASFKAVVQSGRLVVSATFAKSESKAKVNDTHVVSPSQPKSESQAKVNDTHVVSNSSNTDSKRVTHARAGEIANLFDPLLQRSGARLLSPDLSALKAACAEIGDVDHDFLLHFVLGPKGRGARPISGPRAVAAILKECRQNWDKHRAAAGEIESQERRCKCGKAISIDGQCWECYGADS